MSQLLTDAFCRAAKPAQGGRLDVSDQRCAGLSFRVTPNGAKSWNFRFRDPVSRRTLRATIGGYPDVTLSAARERADTLRGQVAAGINPAEVKRRERDEASDRTFKVLADRYMKEHARRHKVERSADGDDLNLKVHILPQWQKLDYRKIRRADVIELIEGIVVAGKHTAANRVHALISKIFSFAIDSDLLESNPAARLRKRGTEKTGKRTLDDGELRLFWRRAVLPPISRQVGLALRLALLTCTRANEVSGPKLSEFSDLDDLKKAAWIIPRLRIKNKRDFLMPLSPLAVETIRAAQELLPDGAEYLFESPRKKGCPIDRHSLAVAMARLADEMSDIRTWAEDPPSPHDLRRTANTRMSALGVPKEDRDACMNHRRRDVGSVHYDMYERAKEKRTAVNKLSASLTSIFGLKSPRFVAKTSRKEEIR